MSAKSRGNGRASGSGGFPGGHTRLPRISHPDSDDPDVLFVESAFYKEPAAPSDGSGGRDSVTPLEETGFGRYFSTESLFGESPEPDTTDDVEDWPFAVLGLSRNASWDEIRRAHRSLVSELHPDRFVDADDEVRRHVETRIRDVNEAFSEIQRHRVGMKR